MENWKYILWDVRYRRPPGAEGELAMQEGVMGQITGDNVYLRAYAEYPDDRRPKDLDVGECIEKVKFRLSGETGIYDVYRVK